jgi:hypothetical protein
MKNKGKKQMESINNSNKKLLLSDVSGSYSKDEIIAAWTKCKENKGMGYVVTIQDLLSVL